MAEDSYMDDKILTTDEAIQFTRMGKQSFQKYYRGLGLKLESNSVTYRKSDLLARWGELKDGDHGRV
ncbi:hypothetical protein ESN35_06835 [Bifidobacterium pullorum subsp. gallinarum]|uniref:Uncharacterized protein n=1 Tax=Bifidobacterium pullorum subsp. gallinarum TaxID=78344 RepID=A0A4V0YB63_9BIFI|nr:hypothetical protein [Bifidobacterium pullorum]QAY33152.1 hypothetical protein ESN35_06835 [Bifidobacterium pullorum subsp. gallinarum]